MFLNKLQTKLFANKENKEVNKPKMKQAKINLRFDEDDDNEQQGWVQETYDIQIDEHKFKSSSKLIVEGVEVYFPFKPYDVQQEYMQSVIQCLNKKGNALLQSPTGTGKTLSLLCATLSWLRNNRDQLVKNKSKDADIRLIKIIYTSRTHSQLKQVAKELKRTVYQPKVCVLGSKDQLCIKPEFRNLKGSLLNQSCQKAISKPKLPQIASRVEGEAYCQFFQKDQKEQIAKLGNLHNRDVMDIEELRSFGQKNRVCPYYLERHRRENADIIMMPYNYVLEYQFLDIVDIQNCIIIFDEAHNIASIAEDGSSFSLATDQLIDAQKEIKVWIELIISDDSIRSQFNIRKDMGGPANLTLPSIRSIESTINCFIQFMLQLTTDKRIGLINETTNERGFIIDGIEIFKYLFQYTKDNSGETTTFNTQKGMFEEGITMENISAYLEQSARLFEVMQEISPGYHFEMWMKFVKNVTYLLKRDTSQSNGMNWIQNPINHFKLFIRLNDKDQCVINLLCLDPAQAFERLVNKNVHSIMLTSGTLTPFSSWECELRLPFEFQLSGKHVVDIHKNVFAGIVRKGPSGLELDFSFKQRQNNQLYEELGAMLINVCRNIPNGVLVVFSSYNLMNKCKFVWSQKSNQILIRLTQIKKCFWEPTISSELQDIFTQYSSAALKDQGAIMFAVCRGKVSEGIDFSDELCRAVFLVGIPYPPIQDKRITLKKEYIDKIFSDNSLNQFKKINSQEWYRQQAIRSTNQALGRVIRHKEDYGQQINSFNNLISALFLCDQRFEWPNLRNDISTWIKPVLQVWSTFSEAFKGSSVFFQTKNVGEQRKILIIDQNESSNEVNEIKGESKKRNNKKNPITYFGLGNKKLHEQLQEIREEQNVKVQFEHHDF